MPQFPPKICCISLREMKRCLSLSFHEAGAAVDVTVMKTLMKTLSHVVQRVRVWSVCARMPLSLE